jgi:uncharacterized membrane protein
MTPPAWALSLAYWLHMLATVVWIGGLASLVLLVIPTARRSLEAKTYADLLGRLQSRLDPLGWLCLLVLGGTGLFQMSANPNYQGFLAISNRWAVAILTKHMVFLLMVGVNTYLTWGLLPQLQRTALLQASGHDASGNTALVAREVWLMRLSLFLGIIILALTALARTS